MTTQNTAIKQTTNAVPAAGDDIPEKVGNSESAGVSNEYSRKDHAHEVSVLGVDDGVTAPDAVVGKALIYVDSADGDLKVKFADGHTVVLSADS